MDKRAVLLAVIGVLVAGYAAITANTETSTPLYTVRMEQVSSEMHFLPTAVTQFSYVTEKGYTLTGNLINGVIPLEEPTVPYTCPETCDDLTCENTCPNTCWNTCELTCPNTCWNTCDDLTCLDTCPNTCELTCPNTCYTCPGGHTCPVTCSYTCGGGYTCTKTCDTCEFPCP